MSAPAVVYDHELAQLWHGDCIETMRLLAPESVHAVVTDPPYGLEFMGREWDGADGFRRSLDAADSSRDNVFGRTSSTSPEYRADATFQRWCEVWAAEALRVLKPGGHLLAFGGSRTWHRLASGIEDAGFEVRDSIAWLYGSGFPKSMDVAKAITGTELGHGGNSGAIRRATMGDEYEASGVRGNRDGVTRRSDTGMAGRALELTETAKAWAGWGTALKPAFEPIVVARKPLVGTVATNVLAHGTGALNIDATRIGTADGFGGGAKGSSGFVDGYESGTGFVASTQGRWPANVVLDESQAAALDEQSGTLTSGVLAAHHARAPKEAGILGAYGSAEGERGYGDSGGASRFFPTFRYEAKATTSERPSVDGVQHPTVKPLDLMRWLVRLVVPRGGTVLEPFPGSGTTLEAAVLEGMHVIGVEREAEYLPLITARLRKEHAVSLFGDWDGAR